MHINTGGVMKRTILIIICILITANIIALYNIFLLKMNKCCEYILNDEIICENLAFIYQNPDEYLNKKRFNLSFIILTNFFSENSMYIKLNSFIKKELK